MTDSGYTIVHEGHSCGYYLDDHFPNAKLGTVVKCNVDGKTFVKRYFDDLDRNGWTNERRRARRKREKHLRDGK